MPALPSTRRTFMVTAVAIGLLAFVVLPAWAADAPGRATAKAPPTNKAEAGKIQVLLITGVDLHDWRRTTPVLAAQLRRDPRLEVRVVEDPHFLDSAAIDRYQVIVLHFMDWKVPAPGEAARKNLHRAVEGGTGLVLVHFACGAWQEWPGFAKLAGRVWDPKLRAHDPHGKFMVEIVDPEHPITKGMKPFETTDELYTCLAGKEPIHVLASAKSKVDHKDYPMAFVHQCGKGRVFHCVLGHDVKALDNAAVGELFARGTVWAAGR